MTSPEPMRVRALPEWVPNKACLTAWPAHAYAWGEHLRGAQRDFVGFCAELLSHPESEPIDLLVADEAAERDARAALAEHGDRVRYLHVAYGDVWLRDTSPIFVQGPSGLECVRFGWNGWGKKYEYPHDDSLAERLSAHYGRPTRSYAPIVEGGALELDGEGTCLTTESCLLNENRVLEPNLSREGRRAQLEQVIADAFGARKTIWLGDGLLGDHTDGHIDNIARFVAPGRVVHMRAKLAGDPNAGVLAAIEASLREARDARGRAFALCPLPAPGRVLAQDGTLMAASYCNFYLGNRVVVMPAFGAETDELARRALCEVFPRHDVRMSSARTFLEGGGTFHCMTRQIPKRVSQATTQPDERVAR